jgi:hypothetical protein
MIEVRKIKYNDAAQRTPAKKYIVSFGNKLQYLTEIELRELQSKLNKFFIPNVIMPTGNEGTVIHDLVGLCPSCGEELSRNGVFNNHNCKKV